MSALLLVVGILGLVSSIVTAQRLLISSREHSIAFEAARAMAEQLRDANITQAFALYNSNAADDPLGPGTAPGAAFDVPGLNAATADGDHRVGEIVFPTVNVGGATALSESVVDAQWNMPRDLNGDGIISPGAMAGPPVMLPARVKIRWRGINGDRTFAMDTVLLTR